MKPYVIRRGDCLTRIAHERGLIADDVWNASENKDLKNLRPHGDMLAPGDVLQLPEERGASLNLPSGGTHRFKAKPATVKLKLVLRSGDDLLKSESYEIHLGKRVITGQTDGDGVLEAEIPIALSTVDLHLPGRGIAYPLWIGDLDPIKTKSGLRARLSNLGFDPGPPGNDALLKAAIADFQASAGKDATGNLDDDTVSALEDAHGC